MALEKEGYKSAIRGTAYSYVPMNGSGEIARASETVETVKTLQFTMMNAANSQGMNERVAATILNFVPGMRTGGFNERMRVIWEV